MMGWSFGINSEGREVGYAIVATCDYKDQDGIKCTSVIDRGLAYCCGDMHDGGDYGCGEYFCYDHLNITEKGQLCEECERRLDDENN
jgi:hypothetical protein